MKRKTLSFYVIKGHPVQAHSPTALFLEHDDKPFGLHESKGFLDRLSDCRIYMENPALRSP
jgi:hypothetical protein